MLHASGAAHPVISNPATVVRNITVLRAAGAVEIHIQANGTLNPISGVLSHPDRILVDLPNVNYDRSRRVEIATGDIKDLRVGLFHANPPVTRVVVDLERPHPFTLSPDGNSVVLRIETAAPEMVQAQPQPEPIARSAQPAHEQEIAAVTPAMSNPVPAPAPAPEAAPPPEVPQVATLHLPPPPNTEPSLQPQDDEEETTPHQAAKEKARPVILQNVRVARGQENLEIHIETSRAVQPLVSTAEEGQRIIVDLPGVTLRAPRRIAVNARGVQDVSASLYLLNPPVTRVLVNLTANRVYHLLAIGNTLTLRIGPKETQVGEKKENTR